MSYVVVKKVKKANEYWYDMAITIGGVDLHMNYEQKMVRLQDVVDMVNGARARNGNNVKRKYKDVFRHAINSDFVRAVENHILSASGCASAASSASPCASAASPSRIVHAMRKVSGYDMVHPLVAIEIIAQDDNKLKIEVYEAFLENKIMENRDFGKEAHVELEAKLDEYALFRGNELIKPWRVMRYISNRFNAAVGIEGIDEIDLSHEVHQKRVSFLNYLKKVIVKNEALNEEDINDALYFADVSGISEAYRNSNKEVVRIMKIDVDVDVPAGLFAA